MWRSISRRSWQGAAGTQVWSAWIREWSAELYSDGLGSSVCTQLPPGAALPVNDFETRRQLI
jgi:hypothetical protein